MLWWNLVLWSPEAAFEAVDGLFMTSGADVAGGCAAVLASRKELVLLGDPQPLERPKKEAIRMAEKSALEHLLNGRKTIPANIWDFCCRKRGDCNPKVWPIHLEFFYDAKLLSASDFVEQVLEVTSGLNGAGLWIVPVEHEGNRNYERRRMEVVARIVEGLLKPEVTLVSER